MGTSISSAVRVCLGVQLLGHAATVQRSEEALPCFPFPPAPCEACSFSSSSPALVTVYFYNTAMPVGVGRYPAVVLVCVSLMTNGVEHLFLGLLAAAVSSWVTLYSNLCPFLIGLLICSLLGCHN